MKHETINLPINYKEKLNHNGKSPTLTTYILDNYEDLEPSRKRPLLLICPGGGYACLANREAEAVAIQANAAGFHAAILRYTLSPMAFPSSLLDLAEAVRYCRLHAQEWNVDKDKIIVSGFSAGGHLAASLGVYWNGLNAGGVKGEDKTPLIKKYLPYSADEIKPNALLLCYPVITAGEFAHRGSIENVLGENCAEKEEFVSLENLVTSDFPPSFIWHTDEDTLVPVENSLFLSLALRKARVKHELHVYGFGEHGLSLASAETAVLDDENRKERYPEGWFSQFVKWISRLFDLRT